MILRLVDGGIPSFEWKLKRVEIVRSEVKLEELKMKVKTGAMAEKAAFKKQFEFKDDSEVNLNLYRKIIHKLPNKPGCLVLAKIDKYGKMIVLEVFKSDVDVREEFKKSKKIFFESEIDRYSWLTRIIQDEAIKEVRFLIGKAA